MNTAAKARKIRLADWFLAAATLLMAALLVIACLDIYRTGTSAENLSAAGVRINDVYTRPDVALRLGNMAWAFGLWVVALAAAIVCRHLRPVSPARPKISPEAQLELMCSRRETTPDMLKERRLRRIASSVCAAVCLLCAVFCALYLFSPDSFASTDLETVMAAMLVHTLPFLIAAFAALMILAQVRHASILREIAAAKQAGSRSEKAASARRDGRAWKPFMQAALYIGAICLIVAGILNGGMFDVLVKAINICTECIGLG